MTTQTEALKLALEALEDKYFDRPEAHIAKAITAIKEALAPRSNPLVIDSDEKASSHMEKSLWEFIDTASMFPRAKPDPRTWPHVMVFAPQRKPLTDEEIEQTVGFKKDSTASLVYFSIARAIEAAHGIKE